MIAGPLAAAELDELAALFNRHRMRLWCKLKRMIAAGALGAHFDADDILNETLLQAVNRWRGRPAGPEGGYVWLYGLVHNQYCDMMRRVKAVKRGGQARSVRLGHDSAAEIAVELARRAATEDCQPGDPDRRDQALLKRDAIRKRFNESLMKLSAKLADDWVAFGYDPSGTTLGVAGDRRWPGQLCLFDVPTLARRGTAPGQVAGPGAGQTVGVSRPGDGPQGQAALHAAEGGGTLLRVASELPWARPIFSPNGRDVASGQSDGSVMVADLHEINRRLTKLRLGW